MTTWNVLTTAGKVRVARALYGVVGRARRLVGKPDMVVVRRRGVRFQLDLAEGIDLGMYLMGVFEYDTYRALQRLVQPGSTVVDVGANAGVHTLPLALMVGEGGRVVAFEPTTYAFDRLTTNLKLNPDIADRVTAVRAYLGDGLPHDDVGGFYASWRLDQTSGQHPKHFGSLAAAADAASWTLDNYAERSALGRIGVMKIDVDGYECRVLRGAKATLTRDRPSIVIEVCPYALEEHGDSAERLLQILAEHGYAFFDESLSPIAAQIRAIEVSIKPSSSINIVALARAGHGPS